MNPPLRHHVVIGTAGHIDHGKTTLVKALTGMDCDRLEEEKRRGITIDLGFAFYGDHAAFVDVPGHERLIKNMVAGASAIRAALLVVAADDGIMPQTREHLAILDALHITHAIVAVTKADEVDDDWIDLVVEEIKELIAPTGLSKAPIVVVDSISNRGLDRLRQALDAMIAEIEIPYDPGFFRLPVDRSFLIKGYGRVVTGSVWSGSARNGDRLILLPPNETYRVRGLQAHEKEVEEVRIGDRAALNLVGDREPVRGEVFFSSGRGVVSNFIDLKINLLYSSRELLNRTRVRVHLGTEECIGRLNLVRSEMIQPGDCGFARFQAETDLAVMYGDLGILRLYSPLETLGGVQVLDPSPPDRKRMSLGLEKRLAELSGSDGQIIAAFVRSRKFLLHDDLLRILPWDIARINRTLKELEEKKALKTITSIPSWIVDLEEWNAWKLRSSTILQTFHAENPDEPGIPKKTWGNQVTQRDITEEVLSELIQELVLESRIRFDGGVLAELTHTIQLRVTDKELADEIFKKLEFFGLQAPLPSTLAEELKAKEEDVRRILRVLKLQGKVVILGERVIITMATLQKVKDRLTNAFTSGEEVSPGEVTELLGSSRKYVVPLLEYLDSIGFTSRTRDGKRIWR